MKIMRRRKIRIMRRRGKRRMKKIKSRNNSESPPSPRDTF